MKKAQVAVVVLTASIFLYLFFFVDKKVEVSQLVEKDHVLHGGTQEEEVYLSKAKAYVDSVTTRFGAVFRDSIEGYTKTIVSRQSSKRAKVASYLRIIKLYESKKALFPALYYRVKLSQSVAHAQHWAETASLCTQGRLSDRLQIPWQKAYLRSQSEKAYRQAMGLDSLNLAYPVALARLYLNNSSQTMQGVFLLLEVTKKQPHHAEANLLLGKYGIISGQTEKAITRLEKVISLQSENVEALFLLAEAYQGAGRTLDAIHVLDSCIAHISNSRLKQQIELQKEALEKQLVN